MTQLLMPKSSYRWIWSIWESLQCTNLWRLVRRMYQPLYQPLKTDVPTFVPTFEDWCTNLCTNLWRLRVHLIDCSYRWIWSICIAHRLKKKYASRMLHELPHIQSYEKIATETIAHTPTLPLPYPACLTKDNSHWLHLLAFSPWCIDTMCNPLMKL